MNPTTTKRIVVLQRGWVAVGDFSQEGTQCTLANASIIRKWGTTNGLGQLAESGPTPNTKLDPAGTMRFHELAIVTSFDVTTEWK